jgi:hypothetical protein
MAKRRRCAGHHMQVGESCRFLVAYPNDVVRCVTVARRRSRTRLASLPENSLHVDPVTERLRERWLPLVERVLRSPAGQDDELDAALQAEDSSLRAVVKEILPVFGAFFAETNQPR